MSTSGRAAALRIAARNGALARVQLAFLLLTAAEYGTWIAVLVYAYRRGGASAAGLVALAQLMPSIVLAPVISAHAIRVGVSRLLALAYLAAALTLAACAAGMLLDAPAVLVYAAAVAFTISLGVGIPLHHVVTPLVVRHPDELTAGNALTGWGEGAGALVGPLLAGVLIALDGTGLACAGLAALCMLTPVLARVRALRTQAIGADQEQEDEPDEGFGALVAAARVILRDPNPRALMSYRAGAAVIEGAIDLLVVLMAIRILAIGPAAAGYLSAAFGAGGVIAASAAVVLGGRHLARPLVASALIGAGALAALTLASTPLVAVLLLLVVGGARTVQSIAAQTLLQRSTPIDVIVCAFALIEALRDAGLAVGSLAIPVLDGLGGPDAAFLGMAALAPLAVALTFRRITTIDREADIPVVEMGLLRNVPIFSALPAAPLETLAREAEYVAVPAGVAIVTEGEPGDRYYVIAAGEVAVSKGGDHIRRMHAGAGFGEIALLHRDNRTATVSARTDTTLLALDRDVFLAALNASPRVHEAASRSAERLLAHAP